MSHLSYNSIKYKDNKIKPQGMTNRQTDKIMYRLDAIVHMS